MAHGSHHRASQASGISPLGFGNQRRTRTIRAIWFHQIAPSRTLDGTTRSEDERKSRLLAAVTLFFPVYRGPELRIELNVRTHVRVFFSRYNLAIDHEDHFRRHPAAPEFLILVELRLRG